MKARIKPLEGKYYGTIIELGEVNDHYQGDEIKVWYQHGEPSARQLKDDGYSATDRGMSDYLYSDCHYETARSYQIAEAIVKALRELP